jgi:hypothetical protein
LLFAAASLISAHVQPSVSENHGQGWDGAVYYRVAEQIAAGSRPHAAAPFVYRLGTPFLAASISPQDLLPGFLYANVIGAGLVTLLMALWLRRHLETWIMRLLVILLFLAQWQGPVRFIYFYPTTADVWPLAFVLAGLIILDEIRTKLTLCRLAPLCLLCLGGTLFREIVALVGLAAIFSRNPVRFDGTWQIAWPSPLLFLPLGCALLGIALSHWMASNDFSSGYSFLREAGYWLYNQPLSMYVHAWLLAYGPVLFLLIFGWRDAVRFLCERQYQLAYLAGVAGLAWIGGADTERFALWAAPVILVLCGRVMERSAALHSAGPIAALAISQVIATRFFWIITDDPVGTKVRMWVFLTPLQDAGFHSLQSHYAGSSLYQFLSFVEYGLVGLVLLGWLSYHQARLVAAVPHTAQPPPAT